MKKGLQMNLLAILPFSAESLNVKLKAIECNQSYILVAMHEYENQNCYRFQRTIATFNPVKYLKTNWSHGSMWCYPNSMLSDE